MSKKNQALDRRELLKALTTLSGAAAASSLLPETWAKPEIGAGLLPAHALSTLRCEPPYEITKCDIDLQQEGNNLTFSSTAWIAPACPGIEMSLNISIEINGSAKSDVPTQDDLITDNEGKVSVTITLTIQCTKNNSEFELDFYSQLLD